MIDPYVYPGTDVLLNKESIRDTRELQAFERMATANRMETLPDNTPVTAEGYREIHRYIFQDVFAWAGEIRSVSIAKGGFLFAAPQFVVAALEPQLKKLRAESLLLGLAVDAFATRCGRYFGEVNAVHPFSRRQRADSKRIL